MDEIYAKLIAQEIAIVGHHIKGIEERLQKPEEHNGRSFYDQAFLDQAMIAAMQGFMANPEGDCMNQGTDFIALTAFNIAKALLAEKKKRMEGGGE